MSNSSEVKRIGRPPGADAEKTRVDILDAALAAFAERGFEGASIREITGAVGVGHNLVRHYFGSKDDLWMAAMRHGLGPMAEALVALLEPDGDGPPSETLRAGLTVVLQEGQANHHAVRLLISEAMRGGPRFDEIFDEFIAPVGSAMTRYLDEMGDDLAPVDQRVAGLYVFASVFSPFAFGGLVDRMGLLRSNAPGDLDRRGRQLIDLIVSGLLRHE